MNLACPKTKLVALSKDLACSRCEVKPHLGIDCLVGEGYSYLTFCWPVEQDNNVSAIAWNAVVIPKTAISFSETAELADDVVQESAVSSLPPQLQLPI